MSTDEIITGNRISTSSDITTKTSATSKSGTSIDSSTSSSALTSRKQSHSQNRDQKQRRSPSFPHNLRRPSDPKTNRLLRAFLATLFGLTQVPLWTAYYVPRFTRPHPQWSWRHAVMVRILRYYIYHIAMLEYSPRLSLSPGLERDRFVVMQQAGKETYVGVAAASRGVDANGTIDVVEAGLVGGTWYPAPLVGPSGVHGGSAGQGTAQAAMMKTTGPIALHFHGGAYMLGAGRILDAGFGASLLIKHAGVSHVLCPQYRLASSSNYNNQSSSSSLSSSPSSSSPGRFPAALQDAITSYTYLINTLKIKPHQIVLSGDSAGGNLVLALLRYITDHGPAIGLEPPSCAWLWSPWVDIANSFDAPTIDASFNSNTDIIAGDLLAWGARAYCGGGSRRFTTAITTTTPHQQAQEQEQEQEQDQERQLQHDPENPYISPLRHPFPTRTPVWIQTGEAEIFCLDNVKFAEQMKSVKGNHVELWIERRAIHDVCLLGTLTGFDKEARSAARRAREFLHAWKIKG